MFSLSERKKNCIFSSNSFPCFQKVFKVKFRYSIYSLPIGAYPFIFCCGYLFNTSDKIWPTSFNFVYIYIFNAKRDVTGSIRHFPNIISREFFN